jgi:hypothetical protein
VIELLGPQHACQSLPHDDACIGARGLWNHGIVELVGLAAAFGKDVVEGLSKDLARGMRIK